jgi:hypothetical protein
VNYSVPPLLRPALMNSEVWMIWEQMMAHCQMGSNIEVAAESLGMRHCRRSVYETVSGLSMTVMRLMAAGCSMDLLVGRAEMRIVDLPEMLLVIGPERLLIDAVLLE